MPVQSTTDDVIGYAWPKPELGPDGLPLPLAARGGAAMVEARARTPGTPQGTVLVSQRRDDASSLGRIKAENLFGELCAAARTPSPNYLPVATLLEMADGAASELKDHPILRAIRS